MNPKCHCCGAELHADFSNNVWCANELCELYDQIFDAQDYDWKEIDG